MPPYFFSAGLSELAALFSDAEDPLLFEVSALLLSEDEPDAEPLPLEEFPFEDEEDFFA